jgi:hypothetical protein
MTKLESDLVDALATLVDELRDVGYLTVGVEEAIHNAAIVLDNVTVTTRFSHPARP